MYDPLFLNVICREHINLARRRGAFVGCPKWEFYFPESTRLKVSPSLGKTISIYYATIKGYLIGENPLLTLSIQNGECICHPLHHPKVIHCLYQPSVLMLPVGSVCICSNKAGLPLRVQA